MKQVRIIKISLNETYIKFCMGKNPMDPFPTQNGLKQGNALLTPLCNLALETAIRKKWN
jgi:hypothetical protein